MSSGSDKNRGGEKRDCEIAAADVSQNVSATAPQLSIDETLLVDPKLLFIGAEVGEGAHRKVYEGRYIDQVVAIKVLHSQSTSEQRAALGDRLIREVNMMSRVKHEKICKSQNEEVKAVHQKDELF